MSTPTYHAATRRAAHAQGITPAEFVAERRARLVELFPAGSTAYTYVTTIARSGMSRRLAVVAVTADGEARNVSGLVSDITGDRWNSDGTLTVRGGGMDVGFATVYALSRAIHGDGYAISQAWL